MSTEYFYQCLQCNYFTIHRSRINRHFNNKKGCFNANNIEELTDDIKKTVLNNKILKEDLKAYEKVPVLKIKEVQEPIPIDEKTLQAIEKNKKDFLDIGIDIDEYEFKIPLKNVNKHITGFTIVDEKDFAEVKKYCWYNSENYARGYVNSNHIQLQNFVLPNVPEGSVVDHISGNKLDNRSANLRYATFPQNGQNRKSLEGSSSQYLGVHWHKNAKKMGLQINL